ncbi:unnamed protein product [Meganyctiphanes norvegica]|uniref:Very long-chain fatty acid transport protein n=1 Tax=Meganyctiphanes norvegica TaxID=48144 RepID=A0AAV2QSJ3_MEGNR
MWRGALVAGVTGALWAAKQQGLHIFGWQVPENGSLDLIAVAAGVYILSGGYYTLWLLYKTLPRDIGAFFKYLSILKTVKQAERANTNIPKLFMENVRKNPNKVALIFEGQEWTFAQIDEYSNRVGNCMASQGFKHGDAVSLFMENRPEFVASWLGCSKIGVVVALINYNLRHTPLIHCIKAANSKALICGTEFMEAVTEIQEELDGMPVFVSGSGENIPTLEGSKNFDNLLNSSYPTPPPQIENVKFKDKLVYIYTSGTTGLPKAALIKHNKYLFFASGVHFMASLGENEVIYNPLPLYHTAGGMVGMGQVLIYNNTAVIRKKFSASNFWPEAKKYGCTVGQYVGELCRYLLNTPPQPEDTQHKVRVMFGNGVRAQIWEEFTERFNMPRIAEFYGATEGIANIMNYEGKPGACGILSPVFRGTIPVVLIKVNRETGEHPRDKNGLCIQCDPWEEGEFVGLIKRNDPVRDFDGYADKKATEKKIIKDVKKKGDMAFLSGDILVMDELGYFYFRDRTGDTFRWRGENVSTTEVEGVVSQVLDNKDAVVYGVEVPGVEGRAGMAAIVDPEGEVEVISFLEGLKKYLPAYARPLFLRILKDIDVTGTFKLKKVDLQKGGFNPNEIKDQLYYYDKTQYVPLTNEIYEKIAQGKAGL